MLFSMLYWPTVTAYLQDDLKYATSPQCDFRLTAPSLACPATPPCRSTTTTIKRPGGSIFQPKNISALDCSSPKLSSRSHRFDSGSALDFLFLVSFSSSLSRDSVSCTRWAVLRWASGRFLVVGLTNQAAAPLPLHKRLPITSASYWRRLFQDEHSKVSQSMTFVLQKRGHSLPSHVGNHLPVVYAYFRFLKITLTRMADSKPEWWPQKESGSLLD
ncbi:hypothetical protein FB567DRAFT_272892 [Paraphoma chrysanthemicola]|uniref:Uncharacterized protein n=1 Tax=Paraphoma chrysanthemicola TaxID=798071 RepID=A0A8K0RE64_9PLEO|nr:hypothetical protein FB567DRAFT_272892 [Paraphoma chrysanthemicola]